MEERYRVFSTALRESRKKNKLTQAELAQKAGISLMSIRRYESGESFPDMGMLGAICVALRDDSLMGTWISTKANDPDKGLMDSEARFQAFGKVQGMIYRSYWRDIVDNGTPTLHTRLASLTRYIRGMNEMGIVKLSEMAEMLSMVPEYQADEEWAFFQKNPGEIENDEG